MCIRDSLEGAEGDTIGAAGIIVPPMHSQALADAMELLAVHTDMRREMAECGRKRVQRYYQHQDMVDNYNKNYEERCV